MTFEMSVVCNDCKAVIRFENEKPEWKDLSEEIEAAHKWVEENPEYKEGMIMPRFTFTSLFGGKTFVSAPNDTRYIECPACGGEAPIGSGPKDDADDR